MQLTYTRKVKIEISIPIDIYLNLILVDKVEVKWNIKENNILGNTKLTIKKFPFRN